MPGKQEVATEDATLIALAAYSESDYFIFKDDGFWEDLFSSVDS